MTFCAAISTWPLLIAGSAAAQSAKLFEDFALVDGMAGMIAHEAGHTFGLAYAES